MNGDTTGETFRLAPMSASIRAVTLALLVPPLALLAGALLGRAPLLALPGVLLIAIYAWVWLRFRPSHFVVHRGGLRVIWPFKRRELARAGISTARVIDREALKREIGWGLRVGAGGLWGAFGWLWTKRRGVVQMYVSRTDRFVWIEQARGRPWLLTPERPEAFVRALHPPRVTASSHRPAARCAR